MSKFYYFRQTIVLVVILMFSGVLSAQNFNLNQPVKSTSEEGCFTADAMLPQLPVWPFTPSCSSIPEVIATIASTGQYTMLQLSAGIEYTFKSNVTTDFITISDENATTALATGFGTLVWTSPTNQLVRFYLHLDDECNTSDNFDRTKTVQCGENPPVPENDTPQTAIALSCGDRHNGNTVNATNTSGEASGDVFYTFTGNGEPELVTVSLCESGFDTYLYVYSDINLTNLVESNDNSMICQDQNFQWASRSNLQFVSDGVTTYYIMIEGWDIAVGVYVIDISCEEVPTEPENCEDQVVLSNLQDGIILGGETEQLVAVDVLVGDQGFTVYGIKPNLMYMTAGPEPTFFNVIFYEDEFGLPGSEYASTSTTSLGKEIVGVLSVFDFATFTLIFDTPIDLLPNKIYWMEIKTDAFAWESTYISQLGQKAAIYDNEWASWAIHPMSEAVYSFICEEPGNSVNDIEKYNFSYYPNPVTDILNFSSQDIIENVSVFNIIGQKVFNESSIKSNQIDLSKLNSGHYLVKVQFNNGQTETVKIVKK